MDVNDDGGGPAAIPRVAVVVAADRADAALAACLAAHARELEAGDELVLAAGEDVACELPAVADGVRTRVVRAPADALTPRRWALGLAETTAPCVRTTIAPCVPASGWRAATLASHRDGAVGVGGAIEPSDDLGPCAFAVWLQRYRRHRRPFARRRVDDVPGDHASYLRSALAAAGALDAPEFWEAEVNARLVAAGKGLVLDPAVVATYAGGESALAFLRRRGAHGVRYGRERVAQGGAARRLLFVVVGPLPGVLFLVKILRDAAGLAGLRRRALAALPWLVAFVAAWAVGEWIGALLGPPRQRPSARA